MSVPAAWRGSAGIQAGGAVVVACCEACVPETKVGFIVKATGEYVVTRFDKKIREFGLTSEEVDRYVDFLRKAQTAMLMKVPGG